MMAKIQIQLKNNNVLTIDGEINFTTVEMPYGAIGFRFNGSSHAHPEELDKYWSFLENVFAQNNINTEDYITLLSITEN